VKLRITIEGRTYDVDVEMVGEEPLSSPAPLPAATVKLAPPVPAVPPARSSRFVKGDGKTSRSPFAGVVISVAVAAGQKVAKGDLLLVIEAMKMETKVIAEADGTVKVVCVAAGDGVKPGQTLVEFE
jgi:glutaconyl-CoA/methylmalonyl-CoA decarboxylase subunit gamma